MPNELVPVEKPRVHSPPRGAGWRFWEWLPFGWPRFEAAPEGAECGYCGDTGGVLDLGDDDFVCARCWTNYVPSYDE